MSSQDIREMLSELSISDSVKSAAECTLARMISSEISTDIETQNPEQLLRFAFLYERLGIECFQEYRSAGQQNRINLRNQYTDAFGNAFACLRSLLYLHGDNPDFHSQIDQLIGSEYPEIVVSPRSYLAFHLAVCGLCSGKTAEVRLELNKFEYSDNLYSNWQKKVASCVLESFVRLVRKSNGWNDIRLASAAVERLRSLQTDFEAQYLQNFEQPTKQVSSAINLVGYYHLAQIVWLVAQYISSGRPAKTTIDSRIDQHRARANSAISLIGDIIGHHTIELITLGCSELVQNSIWTHAETVPPMVRQFMHSLVQEGRTNPIIELWPAQQEALRRNVLSTYHRAILVEMPTSSGKTLLAKFAIVQSRALDAQGTVAYIVPSRALVNQVTRDLRSDFAGLQPHIKVEQSVPAFQIDPTENQMLSDVPDVLVTTPEKLDLLIRKQHPAIRNLRLIIADEAHHLSDVGRGARLELLLATIKRDFSNARFILLSPFLPNDDELLSWLGEELALPAIEIKWRPSNRVVGTTSLKGVRSNRRLVFETAPAADNSDITADLSIIIGSAEAVSQPYTKQSLSRATIRALGARGAVLVLCEGRGTAAKRAAQLKNELSPIVESPELSAVSHFLLEEMGVRTSIIDCLERGVAYHHAGLSNESRWLIEWLVKIGKIKYVCGTTTLAEGVNFPISAVVVETLKMGRKADLTYRDFWNIAGRAGRSLMDTIGIIAFPAKSRAERDNFIEFLQGEAEAVASQLSKLISRADEISANFNLRMIYNNPGLSELLQYLAHAMKVANRLDMAQEVEDIMRSSLAYHQLRREGQDLADQLVNICRSYIEDVSRRREVRGILGLADQTGFATPSVLEVLSRKRDNPGLSNIEEWLPEQVFSAGTDYLTERVMAVSELPEIRLGQGTGRPFSPELVAEILKGWVNGDSLQILSSRFYRGDERASESRIMDFSQYLYSRLISQASWGLGALETICLGDATEETWDRVGYVPSMVYYGVSKPEAVWLRMVGVPRVFSHEMASIWTETRRQRPNSYDEIRSFVSELDDSQWRRILPRGTRLTVQDCRLLWFQLSGVTN